MGFHRRGRWCSGWSRLLSSRPWSPHHTPGSRRSYSENSWRSAAGGRGHRRRDTFSFYGRLVLIFFILQFYLHGVVVEDASVAGVPWRAEVRLVWQREARQSCIRMNKLSEYVRGQLYLFEFILYSYQTTCHFPSWCVNVCHKEQARLLKAGLKHTVDNQILYSSIQTAKLCFFIDYTKEENTAIAFLGW